jgi:hypothetical protein
MIKLKEVYKSVSQRNPTQRYSIREVFVNPKHIRYIRDTSPELKTISECKVDGFEGPFCVISMEKEDIIVVGSLTEIERKLTDGRVLLNG